MIPRISVPACSSLSVVPTYLALVLVAAGTWGTVLLQSAEAQEVVPLSQQLASERTLDPVATALMPVMDNAALRAEHPIVGGGPLRFAEPIRVRFTPIEDGVWDVAKSGDRIWRLRIRSEGARSLNLGFARYHMPEGGRLFIYGADGAPVVGPFTSADNEPHGQLWTPRIQGQEVTIEVNLPADKADELELELGQVGHGFRSIKASKQSGSCNVDVACPEADAWGPQVRSVGPYSLSGSIICTGALVNNTASDRTPYFLTADHCGVSSSTAASMVVYWNYENSTCRTGSDAGGRGDGTLNQFNSGAIYRAGYSGETSGIVGGPDFTLVELDDPIPPEYELFFAGWSRADSAPSEVATIYHPQGQEKRISFELDPTLVTSYLRADSSTGATHLRVGDWDVGTTEPGSSGSPLFNPQKRIVGTLSGGFAACGNSESDWYGRFARAWTGGGTPETRLRDWLDPIGANPGGIEGVGASDEDLIATASAVVDADGTFDFGATGVRLTFSAVSGSGTVTVEKRDGPPSSTDGIAQDNVSSYRFEIAAESSVSFGADAEARLDVGGLDGVSNPDNVQAYRRPMPGSGSFSGLGTIYHASRDEIVTMTSGLGEFVLASDTEPLPVELTRFEARADGEAVALTWRTASETDNAGFEVQRKTPESSQWRPVSFVEGKGTTGRPQQYQFRDTDLPYKANALFYRLRQVDHDGAFAYSEVIEVAPALPAQLILHGNFPNPFSDQTTVRYELPKPSPITLEIYDQMGRRVAVLVEGQQGAGRHEHLLTGHDLSSGVYLLRLTSNSGKRSLKMTAVR